MVFAWQISTCKDKRVSLSFSLQSSCPSLLCCRRTFHYICNQTIRNNPRDLPFLVADERKGQRKVKARVRMGGRKNRNSEGESEDFGEDT